jgi:6-pyruvoyltetrahydropterin/6-carboxytetrahydropterin synthase
MVIEITKKMTFEAAHFLEGYDGLCGQIHGHSYGVEITLTGERLADGQERGMIMDLTRLKKIAQPLIDNLDHSLLVEHPVQIADGPPAVERVRVLGFRPTTENLALWIAMQLQERIGDEAVLARVRVVETATSWIDVIL